MKSLFAFLLSAAALAAADVSVGFTTGQAARAVIGQPTFTSQDPNSSDVVVGAASGIAYAAGTLFVADSNRVGAVPSNHRVLLFQNITSELPLPAAQVDYNQKCPVCTGRATVVLGQPNFTTTTLNLAATANSLRLPTAVTSDGVHLVVADTDHNRVLIWNRIPNSNNTPADVVLGQKDMSTGTSLPTNSPPTAQSLRGPQGVWILNGKLYVADTQNNRVLIYKSIPTANGAAADVVLGAPNFTTFVEPDITQAKTDATASNMLNPVGVSSDGIRLFVTDLGFNRVLVWNTVPEANGAPADFALGQPNLTSSISNYGYSVASDTTAKQTPVLCPVSNGTDTNSNPTYPASCNATMDFPRFALSTGTRLFIADGGNDRVLVYNTMPTQSGQPADYVIGQIGGSVNQASDAADSLRSPMSLAWDGTNLYVSDAYNRRITVYSVGLNGIPYTGVRNAASLNIVATGQVAIGGTINAGDTVKITIATTDYTHKVLSTDTLATVVEALVTAINSSNSGVGDPNVYATPDTTNDVVLLTARLGGSDGNNVAYSTAVTAATSTTTAKLTSTAAATDLAGGGDAAKVAPGTVVSILGEGLASGQASADPNAEQLPTELAGAQVYFNGIRAPLLFVSPKQINAQIPWELGDSTSINAYVRSVQGGGVINTTPVAVTIVTGNPGIFAYPSDTATAPGIVFHGSSHATGVVSVDGSITAADTATITVEDRTYTYTVLSTDTLDSVRDALIALINDAPDPKVTASAAGVFDRIILRARVEGPDGNGISYSGTNTGAILISAFASTTCCANVAGSLVTDQNPAVPGETIVVYATGLGVPVLSDDVRPLLQTGTRYPADGPNTVPGDPSFFVSALAGTKTADVLGATLKPGSTAGTFEVMLHINGALPTNPQTQLTIAQDVYVSNVVTFPVVAPTQ